MSNAIDAAGASSATFHSTRPTGQQWPSVVYGIKQWVTFGSGLPADRVMWWGQNAPRPGGPWISLRLEDNDRGYAWYDRQDNGSSVTQFVRARMTATLTITCYAGVPDPLNPAGPRSPQSILHDVLAASDLESVLYTWLMPNRIGVGNWDSIRSTEGVINSAKVEPRAYVNVRLHLTSEVAELSNWINAVNAAGSGGDVSGTTVSVSRP